MTAFAPCVVRYSTALGTTRSLACVAETAQLDTTASATLFTRTRIKQLLRPEREKQGLLPSRPQEDGIRGCDGERRPADVFLPRGPDNRPAALDFAITSGLRADLWQHISETPNYAFEQYEEFKCAYQDTESHCRNSGFTFMPMILEGHGGAWSPAARRVCDFIERNQTAAWNEGQESTSKKLAQRVSCSLQRENARATLRRMVESDPQVAPTAWELDAEPLL